MAYLGAGVKPLSANFNAVGSQLEVIINDDSRTEGSAWINALTGNAFVAYCHDIHEIRGYNRLTRFASSNYVAAMQDDDVPKDQTWVRRAVSLFKSHPRLAMLGGFRGRMVRCVLVVYCCCFRRMQFPSPPVDMCRVEMGQRGPPLMQQAYRIPHPLSGRFHVSGTLNHMVH